MPQSTRYTDDLRKPSSFGARFSYGGVGFALAGVLTAGYLQWPCWRRQST